MALPHSLLPHPLITPCGYQPSPRAAPFNHLPTPRSSTFSLVTAEGSGTGTAAGAGAGSEVEPKMFEVDYGSGSVLGMEGIDNVSLAGLDLSQVLFGLVLYEDQQVRTACLQGGV